MKKRSVSVWLAAMAIAGVMLVASVGAQGGAYVDLSQVTNDEAIDLYPDVAPDGVHVAYMTYVKKPQVYRGQFDIFVKNIENGDLQRLHDDEADDAFPSWSADGEMIYFDAYRQVDKRAIWKKKVGGGTVGKVTNIPKVAFGADCHPDNERIVFTAIDDGKDIDLQRDGDFYREWRKEMPNLYIIKKDGSGLHDLNLKGVFPKWNPDGDRIAFASNVNGNFEIYTVRADGSDLLRLTTREAPDIEPAWSPDGRFLVFTSYENKNWNLWMIKPNGTGLQPLTTHEEFEGGPMWGPDGYIYFHSDRNGDWDIWRLKPQGYVPVPPDKDGDGIVNREDKCPDEAEDIDGFKDEDGCPDNDNDNDGVPDIDDQCDGEPEDLDGFEDNDGCPDKDNDNDGLPDVEDNCPDEAESPNHFNDQDGCHDTAPVEKGFVVPVYFGLGSSYFNRNSKNLEAMIALEQAIRQMPKAKIILKVYTDSASHRANSRLTDKRAQRLREYLLDKGIAPDQIDAVGLGDAEPITTSRTTTGRKQNNRVVVDVVARNPATSE